MKLTLRDVAEDSLTALVFGPGETDRARGGGLRAGHYSIDSDNTLELSGVAYVPGVTVTGRIEKFLERRESGRLRIGGRAATRGVLRIDRFRITGRLGGRRVSAEPQGTGNGAGVERAARGAATTSPPRAGAKTMALLTRDSCCGRAARRSRRDTTSRSTTFISN